MRRILPVALALLLAACGGGDGDGAEARGPLAIIENLREGGYVLYVRHAATDQSQDDELGFPLSDCAHQRNLTEEGREQARGLGRAIRELRVPIGPVVSSGYCRTRQTAELAFGRARLVDDLAGISGDDDADRRRRVRTMQRLLGATPPPGRNAVIVGHVKNLEAAAERTIEEGDTAVFEPLGGRRFRYVATIPASAWPQLVAADRG